MSLITMGYGHLTILTMGLGIFVIFNPQERVPRVIGEVTFRDEFSGVSFADSPLRAWFRDKEEEATFTDKGRTPVEFGE